MVDASNFDREEATAKFPGLSLSTVVFSVTKDRNRKKKLCNLKWPQNNPHNEIKTHVQKKNNKNNKKMLPVLAR